MILIESKNMPLKTHRTNYYFNFVRNNIFLGIKDII